MRQRFNRNAICSVNGNSGSYETSHKAHKRMLEEKHKSFSFSFIGASNYTEPSDDALVYVVVFGKKTQIPYHRAKAAGMSWTWI